MKRFVITGGGTGGHLGPALAIINQLNQQYPKDVDILYIGSKHGIEFKRAKELTIPFKSVATGKLRRYFSWQNFTDLFRVLLGIFQSFIILLRYNPSVIFSTGGFVSVPVVIAGWVLRKKILIHEQTNSVGLANRIAGRFASIIAITHKDSERYFPRKKVIHTGIPIREELFKGSKEKALATFGLTSELPLIFITGGSQGSHLINRIIKEQLSELLTFLQIIHQCGTGTTTTQSDEKNLLEAKSKLSPELQDRYQVVQFLGAELANVLNACDLIIGRSGAGTVNEAIALQNPAIFIPLQIATRDEQYLNAKVMENAGAAIIIREHSLNGPELTKTLKELFIGGKIQQMKHNIKKLQSPDAGSKITDLIMQQASK